MLIVDDVITAGTAVRESVQLIRRAGATPAGVLIALDREERGAGARSPPCRKPNRASRCAWRSIVGARDLIALLEQRERPREALGAMRAYRERYGV